MAEVLGHDRQSAPLGVARWSHDSLKHSKNNCFNELKLQVTFNTRFRDLMVTITNRLKYFGTNKLFLMGKKQISRICDVRRYHLYKYCLISLIDLKKMFLEKINHFCMQQSYY